MDSTALRRAFGLLAGGRLAFAEVEVEVLPL